MRGLMEAKSEVDRQGDPREVPSHPNPKTFKSQAANPNLEDGIGKGM